MSCLKLVFLILASVVATGCSINHHVANDYSDYLERNRSEEAIPKTDIAAEYTLSDETQSHDYRFRAATVGYANVWIVEFGEMLDATMASNEIQESFKSITKANGSSSSANVIEFDLLDFQFDDYQAYSSVQISYRSQDKVLFSKQYEATGLPQTTQMWAGGAFGMRDAIHDSMKSAIDKILIELLNDLNNEQLSASKI